MTGRCTLNNMNMRNIRRSQDYQCVIIDLAMLGIVSKEEAEMLLGSGVPMNLRLPNGKNNMVSEADLAKDSAEEKPKKSKAKTDKPADVKPEEEA